MRPLSPGDGPSPLGLLNRGPGYLHWKLEVSAGGRTPSAVERLEADKAKYVKTQQVIRTRQEPAWLCGPHQSSPSCRRPLSPHQHNEIPQGLPAGQEGPGPKKLPFSPQSPIARRGSARRILRPDSLVIYRQKRSCSAINKENTKVCSLIRQWLQSPLRDEHSNASSSPKSLLGHVHLQEETSRVRAPAEKDATVSSTGIRAQSDVRPAGDPSENGGRRQPRCQLNGGHLPSRTSPSPTDTKRKLEPSHSLPLSEKERFFNYCGLDRNLVEVLGEEHFRPGSWGVGSSCWRLGSGGSASSEHSCPSLSGQEETAKELSDKLPASVSVVERNARVIKWLYSCHHARTAGKVSTV